MKEILRDIILEFHREALPELIKRSLGIPALPKDIRKAYVFIGMRRTGKTYLMFQHMADQIAAGLDKTNLLYVNFEDDRLENFQLEDFQTLLDVYFKLYPQLLYSDKLSFYFDEIQNIPGWEKFIRRLLDKEKMSIFITGSSAKLLSKEIATSLRGRSLPQEVFPLGFNEYLMHYGVDISKPKMLTRKEYSVIKHHCANYLLYGGFPEILSLPITLHYQTLQSYIHAAVFRDVIERHNIATPYIVKLFLTHCLQNIAAPLSVTKIHQTLKSRGETLTRNNLYDYLSYFEDAYLICPVPLFDFSTPKRRVNPSKIYCVDHGIIRAYSIRKQMEYSACLENAVYIHLRKQEYENIFYYKTGSGKEVDFIAQRINGSIDCFQVCLSLNDEKTKQREISVLVEASNELKIYQAYIITEDHEEIIEVKNLKITCIPYWKFALSIDNSNQTISRQATRD
ncbi:MAG: ATP-binding protein [Proteobacteria bacterium]|nr:ATP-binding protein [Pseudomonadota bacterium]